jgi:hypothetical protein
VLDYALRLPDGQRLTATTTRRLALAPGSCITVSVDPQRIIALED